VHITYTVVSCEGPSLEIVVSSSSFTEKELSEFRNKLNTSELTNLSKEKIVTNWFHG